jgi:hypothetical protein
MISESERAGYDDDANVYIWMMMRVWVKEPPIRVDGYDAFTPIVNLMIVIVNKERIS